jgi:hypothetical protein
LTRRCRICGCTDARACPGGCWWVGPDICSACTPSKGAFPSPVGGRWPEGPDEGLRQQRTAFADLLFAAAYDAFELACLAAFLSGLALAAWPFAELH